MSDKPPTRAMLLSSARQVFSRKGFDGASIREITSRASANLQSVSYHFGSKRALYETVLTDGLSPMIERVGVVANGDGAALDRLERVIDVYFDYFGTNPDLPRLILQEISAGKPPPAPVVSLVRKHVGYLLKIFEDGQKDGSIRETHPFLSAFSVVSQPVMMTLVAPMLNEVGGVDLRNPARRKEAATHVRDLLRGGFSSERASSRTGLRAAPGKGRAGRSKRPNTKGREK